MRHLRTCVPGHDLATAVVLLVCTASVAAQAYPVWAVAGTTPNRSVGVSVAGGVDIDTDGVPDVVVGGGDLVLAISGATGTLIHATSSSSGNNGFGGSVSLAGDVNGDGHGDILVGARTGGTAGTGQAFLLSGISGAIIYPFSFPFSPGAGSSVAGIGDVNLDFVPDLAVGGSSQSGVVVFSGATGAALFTVATAPSSSGIGFEPRPVAPGGDLNGDGRQDIIVGLPPQVTFGPPPGTAQVYSGAGGAVLLTIPGTVPEFGLAVACVGDVTGDLLPDYLVGAPRVFAFQPAAPGFAQVISGFNGSVIRTLTGDANGDAFGSSVAGVGDLDGDGVPDMIVGAPNNGAGYARIFSGATGQVLLDMTGAAASDHFGAALAGSGDVTGDSVPDFVVGAYTADPNGIMDAGRASVLSYAGIPTGSLRFGAGCPGPGGAVPSIGTGGGSPTTATGNPAFAILLNNARPSAPVVLHAGFSATSWIGFPLPLPLAAIGMPGCSLFVSIDFSFVTATSPGAPGTGRAVLPIPIPLDPTIAGIVGFFQWFVVDPGPGLLPGTMSDALQVTLL